jgi:excisionase family DNA binding protein
MENTTKIVTVSMPETDYTALMDMVHNHKAAPAEDRVLTVTEIQEMLKCSYSTVRRLIDKGELKRAGTTYSIQAKYSDVMAYLNKPKRRKKRTKRNK